VSLGFEEAHSADGDESPVHKYAYLRDNPSLGYFGHPQTKLEGEEWTEDIAQGKGYIVKLDSVSFPAGTCFIYS